MDNDIKAWLYDILNAIMEIEGFLNSEPKEFALYQSDLRTKRAVERNIEIIGEALSRILKHDDTIVITNSKKNRGHQKQDNPWLRFSILGRDLGYRHKTHIPILQTEVEEFLSE